MHFSVSSSSSSSMVLTTNSPSVSELWSVTLSPTSRFGYGSYFLSLSLYMFTSGTLSTCLVNPVVPFFLLMLLEAAATLWVSLNSYSTPYVIHIVSFLYVFTYVNYVTSSGWVISSYSPKPKYFTSSSFSQSNGSLFLLSNSISFTYYAFLTSHSLSL